MNVNLNQLRCFYLAAKYKSISKAAEALFVSPPAITMQVKKLEEWLGFRLLCREGNSINVTKDAQDIFKQVEKIFSEVEKLELKLEQIGNKRESELLIGSHYIPAKYLMPKLMAELNTLIPRLNIKVVLDTIPLLMERVQNHDLHFVLSASPPPCPKIKAIPLFTEDLVLVALRGSKHISSEEISIKKIKGLPLLLPEHNTSIFHLISDYLDDAGITPCVCMDNISADVIKNFIMQDMGAAFLLKFSVQEKLDSGKFQEIRIKEGAPVAMFSLSYLSEKNLSPAVQDIVSVLEKTRFDRNHFV